ncbi:hypothetical protein ES332_D09G088700v1 [Gossypium tomentosum]|uniref:Arginyl-tRNA synthetase catalytic core domain-containing protein n=1 Tax=Gossypium tomentosum TaxID=34277 RepID=A0A5D2JEK4_GOSTO|nr:hypothetical protein ES332_D09G088700v1 [Gossypium tomentosum]
MEDDTCTDGRSPFSTLSFSLLLSTPIWFRSHTLLGFSASLAVVFGLSWADFLHRLAWAAKRAGWLPQGDNYPNASHVGFGLVLGEDGKRFRTRNTEVVRLVDLLDEAKNRSKAALIEHGKGEEWTEEEIESTADAVGYGAVKKQFARSIKSQRFPHLFFLVINFDFLDAVMPFIHFCEILKL